jgi:hypothetical protein
MQGNCVSISLKRFFALRFYYNDMVVMEQVFGRSGEGLLLLQRTFLKHVFVHFMSHYLKFVNVSSRISPVIGLYNSASANRQLRLDSALTSKFNHKLGGKASPLVKDSNRVKSSSIVEMR